jgi:membrane protease YdiL (CAAX protease family)
MAAFLLIALPLAWINMFIPLLAGWRLGSSTLVGALLGGLVGGAVVVSALTGGRAAVRRLFGGLIRWRIGVGRAFVVILGLPVLTVGVAAITGTLIWPPEGWWRLGLWVVVTTAVNTLAVNLWEELGWAGFVQARLMARHGLLRGSLLTAPWFFLIHWPLVFQEHGLRHTTIRDAVLYFLVLGLLAPVFRYLIGMLLVDTNGSVLAAGLLHGSLNAAGAMSVVGHAWQHLPALVLLTILVMVVRARQGRSLVDGAAPALCPPMPTA